MAKGNLETLGSYTHQSAPPNVYKWVSAVWKAILWEMVFKGFKKCSISNALDTAEDSILLPSGNESPSSGSDKEVELDTAKYFGTLR